MQLRAYLEALLRDVEEEWGKADPGVVLNVPAPSRPSELGAGEAAALPAAGGTAQDVPPVQGETPAAPGSRAVEPVPGPGGRSQDRAGAPGAEVDLTDMDQSPNGSRSRGRRSGTVSHSR